MSTLLPMSPEKSCKKLIFLRELTAKIRFSHLPLHYQRKSTAVV
jgi:hypothetical protein